MFAFHDTRGAVQVAFTDRHRGRGASEGDLDLAQPSPDDPVGLARLARNLGSVASGVARLGAEADRARRAVLPERIVLMRQVHGDTVHAVTAHDVDSDLPVADALVTDLSGVLLVVRVADCVPVLLADADRRVVGVVHAGRPGLVAGVVPRAVEAMRRLGAEDLVAWLGPHVCGACYEVPADMQAEVTAVVPESFARTSWGTPSVDVGAGVTAQLRHEGVDVVDVSRCTREAEDLWSYRRDGAQAGRLAGLVWVRP